MVGQGKSIRVLLTKSEQDAHEVAIRYIVQALRDAGVEVVFTRYHTIEDVAKAALEEDVSIIGISFYSSGLMHDTEVLMSQLRANKMEDVKLMLGGTISPREKAKLLEMGVDKIFPAGSGSANDIVEYVLAGGGNN